MDAQQPASPVPENARAAFFDKMSALQVEFANAVSDVKAREAALKAALNEIHHILWVGVGETVLNPSHVLPRFMADFNAELASILQDWLDRIEKHDRNTEFRKGFTDCLVVFVLGKVKAGKSSLGNYMAYGRSNPRGAPVVGRQPDFFTAVMAHGADSQAESAVGPGGFFRVGERERTKSIQGFRVPGMTWVDSPGLHSVTPENGALASDYADVADLIVYPMHTGNPGRAGDIAEMQRLLRERKAFLAVITQCDTPEEDEGPDGSIVQTWVMKDKARRDGQVEHVRRVVAESGDVVPFEILSLSVRFAETHDNSPAALEESGVADFVRLLTGIATSDGVRHKRETPSRNLDHFVDLVLDGDARGNNLSVAHVFARLDKLNESLATAAKELDRRKHLATASVLDRVGPVVSDLIRNHADDKNQQGFEVECMKALRQIVAEESLSAVQSLLRTTGSALLSNVSVPIIAEFIKFESLTVKIPKSNRKVFGAGGKAVGGIGGMWAGAEIGALAGTAVPIIGNIIGGLLGGAIGGIVGNFVGNAAGEALGSDWEESMRSGDNRAEVEASAVKALQDAGTAAVDGFFASMKSAAIAPVEQRAAGLRRALKRFSTILKTEVRSND